MASLKEIKIRLASIRNTQKITSAMRMVSSAKLHHTQTIVEHMLEYESKLSAILRGTLSAESDMSSPYAAVREVKQVAIVAFSSNSGLCGTFNANIWKELTVRLHQYEADGITVRIYPIGKKVADELHKAGYQTNDSFLTIGDKPAYEDASRLATALMELYISAQVDRVELLYHHFKNMAEQILTEKVCLGFLTGSRPGKCFEQLYSGAVCRTVAGPTAPQSAPSEHLHDLARHCHFRACRPHACHADSQRQRQRPDPGTDVAIQQKPPAGHHQ